MALFGSIVLGVTLAFLMTWVSQRFFEEPRELTAKRSAIAGVVLVVANYTTMKAPAALAVLFVPVMGLAMLYMYLWWNEEGSSVKELLIFLAMDLVIAVVLNNAAGRVQDLTTIKWLNGIARSLFAISLLISLGFMIADMIWFKDELTDGKIWKGGKNDETGHGTEFGSGSRGVAGNA